MLWLFSYHIFAGIRLSTLVKVFRGVGKEIAKFISDLPDVVVYIVGATPMTDRIGCLERFLVKVMIFVIKHAPYATEEMKAAAERMSRSADFSNRANINALVEYVKAGR